MTGPRLYGMLGESEGDSELGRSLAKELNDIRKLVESLPKKNGNGNGRHLVVPQWLAAILVATMLGMVGTFVSVVLNNSSEIGLMRDNRFSENDWLRERRMIDAELNSIRNGPPTRQAADRLQRLEGFHPARD